MPKPAVFGIQSKAGMALLSWAGRGAPCPSCLASRLAEAGFEPHGSPFLVDTACIPKGLAASLVCRGVGWATVVLLRQGQATGHVLLPFPNCAACASEQKSLRMHPPLPSRVLRDPLTGITSCLERQDPRRDEAMLCCAVNGRIHLPLTAAPEYSSGTGTDMRSAGMAQLGESVERYSAFHPILSRLVRSRASDLGGQAAPVSLFCGYDQRQLARAGYRRLCSTDDLSWAQGISLTTGEKAMVPAAMVYLHPAWPREAGFGPLTSTGTACAHSLEQGRLRAMLEVIERHRLLEAWNHARFGMRLPSSVLPPSHADFLDRLGRNRITLLLRGLAMPPSVPVVLAMVAGPQFPWMAFGSAADRCIGGAAAKAAEEAAYAWQVRSTWTGSMPSPGTLPPVATPYQHSLLGATKGRSRRLIDALSADPPARPPRSDRVRRAAVERELLALCPRAVEVVLTPPDCRLCGFEVLKVVTPGLPTLAFGSVGAPARHLSAHGIPRNRKLHPFG